MKVHQCPSCGGFCKKSGCERRDSVVPCKHFRAGITNKSKEDCPYCRIETLEAKLPTWQFSPNCEGLWLGPRNQVIAATGRLPIKDGELWFGPIPPEPDDKP
jgi:ribosome modulation factor